MGAIAQMFSSVWTWLFVFFARWVSAKVLLSVTAVTAFALLFGSLTILFNASMEAIEMTLPEQFAWGLGIIPTNAPICISTVVTCRIAIWIVQIKWAIINVKLKV